MAYAHTLSKSGDLWTKEGIRCCGKQRLKEGGDFLFHDSTTAGTPELLRPLALMKPYYWWPI